MVKKNLIFILMVFALQAYSQREKDSVSVFQIEYRKTLTIENSAKTFTTLHGLQRYIEFDVSMFNKISESQMPNQLIDDKDDDSVFYITPQGNNVSLVYKEYSTGKFYSKNDIAYKYFLIEDSLENFNWQILGETKEILGYACQLATMDYRGRSYEAWFATELPIGGPWKYDGLPGMILSIQSEQKFISFEAISIKSSKVKLAKIDNPFKTKDAISWDAFKKLYKEKAIALGRYTPGEGDSGGIILSRRGIETYIEENDTEYTADKDFEKSQGNH